MSDLFDFSWDSDYGGGGVYSDPVAYEAYPQFQEPIYADPGSYYDSYYLPDYRAVSYQDPWAGFDYVTPGGSIVQPGAYEALSQEYGGYEQAGSGAGPGSIVAYDPSTGVYFDRAGNPVQPQSGSATGAQTPGTQVSGVRPANPGLVAEPPGTPQGPQGSGGWMDTINSFLKTPLGGLLGAAGVGAAGLGIARGIAGPVPNAPNPQLAPGNPINAAGQNTMAQFYADQAGREAGYQAEQAPGYQGIRNQAMTLIPGQLNPVTVDNYQDPVRAALNAELMATQPRVPQDREDRAVRPPPGLSWARLGLLQDMRPGAGGEDAVAPAGAGFHSCAAPYRHPDFLIAATTSSFVMPAALSRLISAAAASR